MKNIKDLEKYKEIDGVSFYRDGDFIIGRTVNNGKETIYSLVDNEYAEQIILKRLL